MTIRLRTIWDVRAFSVTLTTFVMICSLGLQNLLIEPDIAYEIRWPGMLISYILAAPITYFIGLRMYEIHRLNVDVKRAAAHDGLTGLLHRHAFVEQVKDMTQHPGVLLMADIDHFKAFNDQYGHATGDAVLKAVARVFRSFCRAEDLAARFGGEEFMIFLPDTSREDGIAVAERLRKRLGRDPMAHEGQSLKITASFGVAVLDQTTQIEEVIDQADTALYESKHLGRNRVSAAP